MLAHQERKARYRLDVCDSQGRCKTATAVDLNGSKSMVPAGDKADAFIVPGHPDGKIALFLVERTAAGVTAARLRHAGRRPRRRSRRSPTRPPRWSRPDGLPALEHAVDIGIAAACAEAVGVMDKTMASRSST